MSAWWRHVDEHAPWAGILDEDCTWCRNARMRAVCQEARRDLEPSGFADSDDEVTVPDALPLLVPQRVVR